jgi:hypothetical protein
MKPSNRNSTLILDLPCASYINQEGVSPWMKCENYHKYSVGWNLDEILLTYFGILYSNSLGEAAEHHLSSQENPLLS